jgi:hypothetical protein
VNSRQERILRVLSSIAVGAMAFLIAFPLVLLVGGVLLGPRQSDILIPPQLVILLLISTLVGLIVAIFAGTKYYRYLEKKD